MKRKTGYERMMEESKERRALVWKLVTQGATFSQIGAMLNISRQRAYQIWRGPTEGSNEK